MELQQHYRAKEVAARLGVHKNTVWKMARDGRLPKPIKLGNGTSVWSAEMVQQAIAKMKGAQS